MEIWEKEEICVDTLWNVVYTISSFYNKKVNIMSYIFNEVIETAEQCKNSKLSLLAKKKLFENNILKYFAAVRDASLDTIVDNETPSEHELDGQVLNERGFARLSTLSNINSEAEYNPRTNKNIYLALGNALSNMDLEYTQYEEKGMFEIIYDYLQKHTALYKSTAKSIANSFCSNIENNEIINIMKDSFQKLLLNRVTSLKRDLRQQYSDEFTIKIIDDVIKEIDAEYDMFSVTINNIIAKKIPEKILAKYPVIK